MITNLHLSNLKGKQQNAPHALVCTALLALLCTGCVPQWRYIPEAPVDRQPLLANSVTVPQLVEGRPPYQPPNQGLALLLAFTPGVLYQESDIARLEETSEYSWKFQPKDDIARALADEISNRRIFSKAEFAQNEIHADLILRGRLTSTRIESTSYQYGLTILGPALLMYVGAPIGKAHVTLAVDLELEEPQTKVVLWKRDYKGEREFYMGLYYGPKGEAIFDSMLKELMPQILSDLERAIKGMTTAAPERTREQ